MSERTEAVLRAPADLLEFVKQTSLLTWRVGPDGYVMNIPEWCALTGQTPDEVQGDGWMNALHPEDVERTRMAWHTAVAHGTPYNTDYRIKGVDDVYRWVNSRGVPIFEQDGSISHWVGAVLAVVRFARTSPTIANVQPIPETITDIMPAALRGARGMLNWSSERLAREAGISMSTTRRLEAERSSTENFRQSSIRKLVAALAAARIRVICVDNTVVGVEVAPDWHPPD